MVGIAAFFFLAFMIGVVGAIWTIGIYNSLIALRNQLKNGFSQIDVQLRRRYDLIPNLVESTKAYLKHERETLEAVIQNRNQAVMAVQKAAQNPSDTHAMHALIGAEAALGGALSRLMAVVESYPDLKANESVAQLKEELVSTENRVAFARQAYNDSVMVYNTSRERFPNSLISGFFRFEEAPFFEVTDASQREAPKVKLT